jgi:hypothetical protein
MCIGCLAGDKVGADYYRNNDKNDEYENKTYNM